MTKCEIMLWPYAMMCIRCEREGQTPHQTPLSHLGILLTILKIIKHFMTNGHAGSVDTSFPRIFSTGKGDAANPSSPDSCDLG